MVGTGLYMWKSKLPTSLKVIHARMVAQGVVIAGLCGVGAYALYDEFVHPPAPQVHAAHTSAAHASVVNHNKFQETFVKGKKPAAAPVAAAAPAAHEIQE